MDVAAEDLGHVGEGRRVADAAGGPEHRAGADVGVAADFDAREVPPDDGAGADDGVAGHGHVGRALDERGPRDDVGPRVDPAAAVAVVLVVVGVAGVAGGERLEHGRRRGEGRGDGDDDEVVVACSGRAVEAGDARGLHAVQELQRWCTDDLDRQ